MNPAAGYPKSIQALMEAFSSLPGVGIRTAERLALHVLSMDDHAVFKMADALREVKSQVRYCLHCFNLSESELCSICSDEGRDRSVVCVVEQPKDIITIEKAGAYQGQYHVLLGSLSPLDGIGPKDIRIPELEKRIQDENFEEILIATTSDTEGEATAMFLTRLLKKYKIRITRLAQGVPMGTDLEFTDRATLIRAIETRREATS